MVEFAPATGGLALWVRHHDLPGPLPAAARAAPDLPRGQRRAPVATDGSTLQYDPSFGALPLLEQTGLVAHEVLHIALRHPQRYGELQARVGDVDLRLFNTCADAIVNSTLGHLAWLHLPPEAVTLEALLAAALGETPGAEAALLAWDVERLYRAIDDRREAGRDGSQRREDGQRSARVRQLGANTPLDLVPSPGAPEAPEARAEQQALWQERLLRSHASDGVFSMLRTLPADLPRIRTPWEQFLRTQLSRALAPQRELSWSRPSRSYLANQGRSASGRRLPFEPGSSASRAVPRVALVVDVSGSIDAALLTRFAREIEALTRRLESELVLILGDDRVRHVAHLPPGCPGLHELGESAHAGFAGGGGTDFAPLLEEAWRHRPDIVVVLTDLDGPALCQPRCPVLWAVTEAHADAVPPFGRKLVLN